MSDASPGLLASLRGLATTSVALIRTRLELLRVEAQEEVGRVTGLLLWTAVAVLCGVLGLAFLGVFLTVLLWDGHRLLALGIFTALFLVAAAIATMVAVRLLRQGSQLFSASLAELRRDEAALRKEEAAP
ncbi:MAG: phage holin family protein [Rhodocyclaceae bacterium]